MFSFAAGVNVCVINAIGLGISFCDKASFVTFYFPISFIFHSISEDSDLEEFLELSSFPTLLV